MTPDPPPICDHCHHPDGMTRIHGHWQCDACGRRHDCCDGGYSVAAIFKFFGV